MEDPVNLESLLPQARALFEKTTGSTAVFSHPVVLKNWQRSLIVRCQIESTPASIILKQIKEPVRGFSDWASLEFLSGLPEAQAIAPRFYGGDVANRIFLIEDLGEGSSLQSILSGPDSAAARTALQALALQMARLHAATMGKEPLFEATRSALPEAAKLGRQWEARQWLDNQGKVAAWFDALDRVPPSGFEKSLDHIASVYRRPNDFLAFTHGDPAPTNNHVACGKARLLDFEYGTFRHALYDITAWNILCPLPLDCMADMRRCFQEELAKTFPAAQDEARFAEEWACLCAYRALAMLTWISPDILTQNRPWADAWTMREAVFVALSRMQQATAPFAQLEPVSRTAATLTQSLRERWPEFENAEALLPPWQALKNSSLLPE